MNALLSASALVAVAMILVLLPGAGVGALAVCAVLAVAAGLFISRAKENAEFLLRVFAGALLMRVAVGTVIYYFNLQDFFGGDAYTYDVLGMLTAKMWRGEIPEHIFQSLVGRQVARNYGMMYVNGVIYFLVGQNMLAVQYVNAVAGAATAPLIYLCAHRIFRNVGVARASALFVAFYPSLVLWSSQGLKDGPIVFLLALSMLATLRLDEKFSVKHALVLSASLAGILSLRFYLFYMLVASIGGAFLIGIKTQSVGGYARRFIALGIVGLALLQLGSFKSANDQLEIYGNLETLQRSRANLAVLGASGYGRETDVSTTKGAISAIPVGLVYLLFAPFPWQLASLRQSITLPEMLIWWGSFPLLCAGLWFTLRHRLRQALPILVFTMMLTLAYSVFQGNVGTAYRQRSQLLVFYFIFVAVGYVLMKERREDRVRASASAVALKRARLGVVARERAALPTPAVPNAPPQALEAGGGETRSARA